MLVAEKLVAITSFPTSSPAAKVEVAVEVPTKAPAVKGL